jgi:hypothetical protein
LLLEDQDVPLKKGKENKEAPLINKEKSRKVPSVATEKNMTATQENQEISLENIWDQDYGTL